MTRVLAPLLAFVMACGQRPAIDPAPMAETADVAPGPSTAPAALDPASAALPLSPVYVRVLDWRHMSKDDVVGQACAHLRLRCEATTYTTGAITIVLTDPYPPISIGLPGFPMGVHVLGVSSGNECEGRVWAVSDMQVVAHEMGHALGLPHVMVEGNLLFPSRDLGGLDLTADQRQTIRHGARVMRRCA